MTKVQYNSVTGKVHWNASTLKVQMDAGPVLFSHGDAHGPHRLLKLSLGGKSYGFTDWDIRNNTDMVAVNNRIYIAGSIWGHPTAGFHVGHHDGTYIGLETVTNAFLAIAVQRATGDKYTVLSTVEAFYPDSSVKWEYHPPGFAHSQGNIALNRDEDLVLVSGQDSDVVLPEQVFGYLLNATTGNLLQRFTFNIGFQSHHRKACCFDSMNNCYLTAGMLGWPSNAKLFKYTVGGGLVWEVNSVGGADYGTGVYTDIICDDVNVYAVLGGLVSAFSIVDGTKIWTTTPLVIGLDVETLDYKIAMDSKGFLYVNSYYLEAGWILAPFEAVVKIDPTTGAIIWRRYTGRERFKAIATDGIVTTPFWFLLSVYVIGDIVQHGGDIYECILGHTAAATDEPGVGINWATFWVIRA